MEKGNIDITNLNSPPEKAELATANYFASIGKRIVFIRPSLIPNQHTPDILMDGVEWEIKCPEGSSKRTIENNMRKAIQQANNLIFDLRNIRLPEGQCISQLEGQFHRRLQIKRLYIIKKNGELIYLQRKH